MKSILSPLVILLFFACGNAEKLLDNGNPDKALEIVLKRLDGNKVKYKDVLSFEKAFNQVTNRDKIALDNLKYISGDDRWPRIFDAAIDIQDRQDRVYPILQNLDDFAIPVDITFLELEETIEEARENSAKYFYNLGMAYLQDARQGDKRTARNAYNYFEETLGYIPDFKDASELSDEMREIGTAHYLLNPTQGRLWERNANALYQVLFYGQEFPMELDWNIIHLHESDAFEPHYLIDLYFDSPNVSFDRENRDICNANVEVENGYTTELEWNPVDSAYVEVRTPAFITVNATITTVEQEKEANIQLNVALKNISELNVEEETYFTGQSEWENLYSVASGDNRAVRDGNCEDYGGSYAVFPSDDEMVEESIDDSKYSFYNWLEKLD